MRRIVLGLTVVLIAGIGLRVSGIGIGMPRGDAGGIAYITAPVERGDVITTLSATGSLRALETVQVGSQLSGQIAELLVDFNDEVTEGDPLAKLDPSTFESEVREAEAALEVARAEVLKERATLRTAAAELASAHHRLVIAGARVESARAKVTETERDLRRKRTLAETKVLAEAHVDQAMTTHRSAAADLRAAAAEVKVAQEAVVAAEARQLMADANLLYAEATESRQAAELDQAQIDLARTVIAAPIDGVVVGRDVDRGQTVAASLEAPTLFMLARDLREMEVHANIDEADIGRIALGQRASFTVDAYPGREFAGTVMQIRKAPELIQNVVTYTVVIAAQNADLALLPGMTAIVHITVEEARNVLKVPNAALQFVPRGATGAAAVAAGDAADGAVVWIKNDQGDPTPVRITPGRSNDSATEIVGGPLRVGQPVIIGTASTASDDTRFGFRWKL